MTRLAKSRALEALPIVTFVLFGLVAIAARSQPLPVELPFGMTGRQTAWDGFVFSGLPVALRLGAALISDLYHWLFAAIGHLMMIAPDSQPLFVPPPPDWPVKWWGEADFFGWYAPFLALYATRLTLLVPVYVLARRFLPTPATQALAIALVLVTIGGWPPILVSAFLGTMRRVIDWPLAYYNFGHELMLSDFAAIGFAHLLVLTLASPLGLRAGRIALLAAAGQFFFENLGFLTGVAAATAALLHGDRNGGGMRVAIRLLAVAALASAPVLAFLLVAKLAFAGDVIEGGGSTTGYLLSKWQSVARQNFLWFKLVVAHMVSLSVYPLAFGALFGLVLRVRGGLAEAPSWRIASAAVLAGGLACMAVGSLVSGFFPDLGRQVAFLISVLPILALSLVARGRRVPTG
jgi:hypothetical protein